MLIFVGKGKPQFSFVGVETGPDCFLWADPTTSVNVELRLALKIDHDLHTNENKVAWLAK